MQAGVEAAANEGVEDRGGDHERKHHERVPLVAPSGGRHRARAAQSWALATTRSVSVKGAFAGADRRLACARGLRARRESCTCQRSAKRTHCVPHTSHGTWGAPGAARPRRSVCNLMNVTHTPHTVGPPASHRPFRVVIKAPSLCAIKNMLASSAVGDRIEPAPRAARRRLAPRHAAPGGPDPCPAHGPTVAIAPS